MVQYACIEHWGEISVEKKCDRLAKRVCRKNLLQKTYRWKRIEVTFLVCGNIMKVTPLEWALRKKIVDFEITSIGVTSKKLWRFYCQGPVCKYFIHIWVLNSFNRKRFGLITSSRKENVKWNGIKCNFRKDEKSNGRDTPVGFDLVKIVAREQESHGRW